MSKFKSRIIKVFLLLFLSNTAIATSINSFEILSNPNKKIFLLTANISGKGVITIKVISKKGENVCSRNFENENSFEQEYSLKDFEQGTYFLQIEDESKIMTQPFIITSDDVDVDNNLKSLAFKPQIGFDSETNLFAVDWLKTDKSKYILTIEDEKSNQFFVDNLTNEQVIHKYYDFSKLPSGRYYITIKDKKYTYTETVEVK